MEQKIKIFLGISVAIVLFVTIIGGFLIYQLFFFEDTIPEQYLDWEIRFTGNTSYIKHNISYTLSEFVDLPSEDREYELRGKSPAYEKSTFRGVDLAYLMTDVLEFSGTPQTIQFIAEDGYGTSFTYEEVVSMTTMMIAYKKDNYYLRGSEEDDVGPLRLIIPSKGENDFNGQLCAKYLVEVVFA